MKSTELAMQPFDHKARKGTSNAAELFTYRSALEDLEFKDRLRSLTPRSGIDFTSNDYLGLAESPRMRQAIIDAIDRGAAVGAGGSRLLRGNTAEHEALETTAALFFHSEHALYFSTGYAANFALFSTLPQSADLVMLDELSHASMREGAHAGRARHAYFSHNDIEALEKHIHLWRRDGGSGRVWIAVESLYSMDGDRAPLIELTAVADKHEAWLVVDEAHATGVFGLDGRGLTAAFHPQPRLITLHTCSKALGAAGALICAPRVLCDFLLNRCRTFIYSTAPSPLMAVASLEGLKTCQEEPYRRERLTALIAHANLRAATRGIKTSDSQILPVIVGEDAKAMAYAKQLRERGFDVRAIRPPTVPDGTARLRISITLNVDESAINELFATMAEVARHLPTGQLS